jgi:energy-coupling factor transport system permease protein
MSDITFGRYVSKDTFVHKIDPRNKIFLMILLFVGIFLQFKLWSTSLIISGVLLLLLVILLLISKVSLKDLFKSLLSMWILILFLMAIYIFIPNPNYYMPAFKIGDLQIYWDAFYLSGYIMLRLIMMISITMILTSTTKPMDLTRGLEWYMKPLKIIKFPAHEIAMTISIALRFIPTILDETKRIMKAQSSRGVDFNHGGLIKKFKAIISLIIPLFISAIERSDELALAMEARGYDPSAKRTSYRKLKFSYYDLISTLIILALFGGILTLFIFDQNVSPINIIEFIFKVNPGF